MIKVWTEEAWDDFEYWTKPDKKTLKISLQWQMENILSQL